MDKLADLRQEIDIIDNKLIDILAQRMEISRKIGIYKSQMNIEVFQPQRFEAMMKQRLDYAETGGLNRELIAKIFSLIHEASKKEQFTTIAHNK